MMHGYQLGNQTFYSWNITENTMGKHTKKLKHQPEAHDILFVHLTKE
jgi:hypothetical protein